MSGKGKGAIKKRRKWRSLAFRLLGSRSLVSIPKGDRSDTLRNILKSKKKDSNDLGRKK